MIGVEGEEKTNILVNLIYGNALALHEPPLGVGGEESVFVFAKRGSCLPFSPHSEIEVVAVQ